MGFQDRCSNPGRDDNFTCPACYNDHFNVRRPDELTKCEQCGAAIKCSIEYDPVAVCEIVKAGTQ